jgi:hypothetical protein
MKSLRPLLGLIRFDNQRNPDIHNRLKVNNLIKDIKLYQKSNLGHVEGIDRSYLFNKVFNIDPRDDGMLEDPGKDGKFRS